MPYPKLWIVVAELATHLYRQSADGLYVCGVTGDCYSMRVGERKRAAEIVAGIAREFNGATIVHVGAGNMRDSIELAEHAMDDVLIEKLLTEISPPVEAIAVTLRSQSR